MFATASAAPARSLEQRFEALSRANDIRIRRASLKRDLKAGRKGGRHVLAAIDQPPAWLHSMKVHELLMAIPKLGRVKVNRTLIACQVSPSKTLGGLSPRQRKELLAAVAGLGPVSALDASIAA